MVAICDMVAVPALTAHVRTQVRHNPRPASLAIRCSLPRSLLSCLPSLWRATSVHPCPRIQTQPPRCTTVLPAYIGLIRHYRYCDPYLLYTPHAAASAIFNIGRIPMKPHPTYRRQLHYNLKLVNNIHACIHEHTRGCALGGLPSLLPPTTTSMHRYAPAIHGRHLTEIYCTVKYSLAQSNHQHLRRVAAALLLPAQPEH